MVHCGLCRELFTLRGRTEKENTVGNMKHQYIFWKKLRIEVLSDGLFGGFIK